MMLPPGRKIVEKQMHSFEHFDLHACLPFIELAHETTIEMGPVLFWPSSKAKERLPAPVCSSFDAYLEVAGQIKAKNDERHLFFNTATLIPKRMTCVSISRDVPDHLREFVLIDSLYLLYFACTFRNLYYGQEIPSFAAFRKMIPASLEFISSKNNWQDLFIHETDREETTCLHLADPAICQGLGKALEGIYQNEGAQDLTVQQYKRLVRSIRYLVDRFFQRFVNLFKEGLKFHEALFEPEDVIFLSAGFETLFGLNEKQPAADFKHKLRTLLHLKYSTPLEIFWKWVDDFYRVRRRLLNGDPFIDPLFRHNPNFEISHIFLGIKLFVYAAYYQLYHFHLIPSSHEDSFTPPVFKWIHPEEILLFFWTEPSLLHKLNLFIKQCEKGEKREDLLAEIHLLTSLFVSLYDRYFAVVQLHGQGIVRFVPASASELTPDGSPLLQKLKESERLKNPPAWSHSVHPNFSNILEMRLNYI